MSAPTTVMIISFSYWPMVNARAFRWTALAEHWASKGFDVHVVCAWLPGRPREEVVNGVRVHRCGSTLVERVRAALARRRGAIPTEATETPLPAGPRRRGFLSRAIALINEKIWRRLYWPDTTCLWYFSAVRAARRVAATTEPAALVSVSPTFTAVLVGRRLVAGPLGSASWLIDLGDPFCFGDEAPPNNLALYRDLNVRVERACFARAGAVSVTTQGTLERYARLFPESAHKIEVVPPLLSLTAEQGALPSRPTDGPLRIVYVGTLYRAIRRPDYLLSVFRALRETPLGDRLELHFYGDLRDCRDSFAPFEAILGRTLFLHGTVPRAQAIEAMSAAAMLINIGNDTPYQLPSKMLEYIALGRPILNIAKRPDDSSAAFLGEYPRALTVIEDEHGPTREQIGRMVALLEKSEEPMDPSVIKSWLEACRIDAVSDAYLRLLGMTARQ